MKLLLSFLLLVTASLFILIESKPVSTDKENVASRRFEEPSNEGAGLWVVEEEAEKNEADGDANSDTSSGDNGTTSDEDDEEEEGPEEGSAVEASTTQTPGKDVEEDAGKRDKSVKGKKRDCDCGHECEHEHGCHHCGHEHEHCCHDGCHHCHGEHHGAEEGHHCHDCEHGYEKFEEWGDECGNDNSECGHHHGCHEHCDHHDDHGHHEDCHGHHCCGHCKVEGDGDDC